MSTATGAPRTQPRTRQIYKPPSNKAILDQLSNPASWFWREQAMDAHDLLVSKLSKEQANAWHALWIASDPTACLWHLQHRQITIALEAAAKLDPRTPGYILELAFTAGILTLDAARQAAAEAANEWVKLASNPNMYPEPIERARKLKDRMYEIVAQIALTDSEPVP